MLPQLRATTLGRIRNGICRSTPLQSCQSGGEMCRARTRTDELQLQERISSRAPGAAPTVRVHKWKTTTERRRRQLQALVRPLAANGEFRKTRTSSPTTRVACSEHFGAQLTTYAIHNGSRWQERCDKTRINGLC